MYFRGTTCAECTGRTCHAWKATQVAKSPGRLAEQSLCVSPTHPPFASRCSRIDGLRTDKRAFRCDMTRSPSAVLFFIIMGGAVAFPDKIKGPHTFSSTMRSRVAGEELWRLPAPHLHRDTRRPSPTFPLLAKCIVTASQRERNPAALFRLTFATARSQGISLSPPRSRYRNNK